MNGVTAAPNRQPKLHSIPKHAFGHSRSSEQHADGFDRLTRCDFLLVLFVYSTFILRGTIVEF